MTDWMIGPCVRLADAVASVGRHVSGRCIWLNVELDGSVPVANDDRSLHLFSGLFSTLRGSAKKWTDEVICCPFACFLLALLLVSLSFSVTLFGGSLMLSHVELIAVYSLEICLV